MSQASPNITYKNWIEDVKKRVRSTQIKAAIAVNSALIEFYWELGKMLHEKQTAWGTGFLENVSRDLKMEFPEMAGFSVTNLKYCRLYYAYFSPQVEDGSEIRPQAEDEFIRESLSLSFQLPWGHIKELISKVKEVKVVRFYIEQTIANNWSRDTLALQIKSELHKRQGKSINNFQTTLPEPLSDLAQQTLKDPYVFDFMTMITHY